MSISLLRIDQKPEIQKLKILSSEFCPISRDWGELGMPNLTRMSLMKCYWMLQNARVTAFTVPELLRKNQQGWRGEGRLLPPSPRLGLMRRVYITYTASSPSMKPTLTQWGGLPNQEVSISASVRRACRSDATTFEQNKRTFLRTFSRTGFSTEVYSYSSPS